MKYFNYAPTLSIILRAFNPIPETRGGREVLLAGLPMCVKVFMSIVTMATDHTGARHARHVPRAVRARLTFILRSASTH